MRQMEACPKGFRLLFQPTSESQVAGKQKPLDLAVLVHKYLLLLSTLPRYPVYDGKASVTALEQPPRALRRLSLSTRLRPDGGDTANESLLMV